MEDDLLKISSEIGKLTQMSKNSAQEIFQINRSLSDISNRLNHLETKVNLKINTFIGVKKTILAIAAIVSFMIGIMTFYSEVLIERPSPKEQQKNIDLLWSKYDQLLENKSYEK